MIRFLHGNKGQASLEFAAISAVIMIAICVLALVWHMAADGKLAQIIDTNASHDTGTLEGLLDVAAY